VSTKSKADSNRAEPFLEHQGEVLQAIGDKSQIGENKDNLLEDWNH